MQVGKISVLRFAYRIYCKGIDRDKAVVGIANLSASGANYPAEPFCTLKPEWM
jgi:hypothetical protein